MRFVLCAMALIGFAQAQADSELHFAGFDANNQPCHAKLISDASGQLQAVNLDSPSYSFYVAADPTTPEWEKCGHIRKVQDTMISIRYAEEADGGVWFQEAQVNYDPDDKGTLVQVKARKGMPSPVLLSGAACLALDVAKWKSCTITGTEE